MATFFHRFLLKIRQNYFWTISKAAMNFKYVQGIPGVCEDQVVSNRELYWRINSLYSGKFSVRLNPIENVLHRQPACEWKIPRSYHVIWYSNIFSRFLVFEYWNKMTCFYTAKVSLYLTLSVRPTVSPSLALSILSSDP